MLMLLPILDSVKGMQLARPSQPIRSNDLSYQPQVYLQQQNPGHTQLIQARAPAAKQMAVPKLDPFLGHAINSQAGVKQPLKAGLRQPLKETTTTVAPGQIRDIDELWTSEKRCCCLPDKRLATKDKITVSWFEDPVGMLSDGRQPQDQQKTAVLHSKTGGACWSPNDVYESRDSFGKHDGKYVLEFGQLEGQRDKNGKVSRNAGYEYNTLRVDEGLHAWDDDWEFTYQQELQRKLPIMRFKKDGEIRKVVLPSVNNQERAEHQQQTRSDIEGRLAEIHYKTLAKWGYLTRYTQDISDYPHAYTFADDKGFRADDGPLMPIHVSWQ